MLNTAFLMAGAFVFGSIIGSFLNVVIHRLPRGESLVSPGSRCPHCGTAIPPWHNIPVLSYFILRGRCRTCMRPISGRYPLVEAANGLLYVCLAARFGLGPESVTLAVYCSALIAVTGIDVDHKIIPDVITIPGMALGLISTIWMPLGFVDSLAALLAGGGFFYAVAVISRGGMGGGDIKLTAMMGAFLGLRLLAVAVFLGLLTGSLIAVGLLVSGRKSRKDIIPFGPFLALGGISVVFWGERIIEWYLRINAF